MTPPDAHRDIGVHTNMLVRTRDSVVYPGGTSSEQLLTGTVLFYPCSHVIHNSVFTGTGPVAIPGIPRVTPR